MGEVLFGGDELFGNSFDNLDQTLLSLVAYLSTGSPSDPETEPEPVEGWNFEFKPWLLDWLVESLETEEEDRVDSIEKCKLHILFDQENISPEERLETSIQATEIEVQLVKQAIHLAKQWVQRYKLKHES